MHQKYKFMENSLDLRKKRLKTQVIIETFVIKRKKVQDPGYSSMAVIMN